MLPKIDVYLMHFLAVLVSFNAPWYSRDTDICQNLEIDDVATEIKRFAKKHKSRLHLTTRPEQLEKRLKRLKLFDSV